MLNDYASNGEAIFIHLFQIAIIVTGKFVKPKDV